MLLLYSIAAIALIFLGSLLSNDLVWELTDFFNYLMVLPNAIALIALGRRDTGPEVLKQFVSGRFVGKRP